MLDTFPKHLPQPWFSLSLKNKMGFGASLAVFEEDQDKSDNHDSDYYYTQGHVDNMDEVTTRMRRGVRYTGI